MPYRIAWKNSLTFLVTKDFHPNPKWREIPPSWTPWETKIANYSQPGTESEWWRSENLRSVFEPVDCPTNPCAWVELLRMFFRTKLSICYGPCINDAVSPVVEFLLHLCIQTHFDPNPMTMGITKTIKLWYFRIFRKKINFIGIRTFSVEYFCSYKLNIRTLQPSEAKLRHFSWKFTLLYNALYRVKKIFSSYPNSF